AEESLSGKKFRDFLHEWPTPGTGPYFDTSVESNITGLVGNTVLLHCRVKNLGNRTLLNSSKIVPPLQRNNKKSPLLSFGKRNNPNEWLRQRKSNLKFAKDVEDEFFDEANLIKAQENGFTSELQWANITREILPVDFKIREFWQRNSGGPFGSSQVAPLEQTRTISN
ncbi:hypothetical protein GWI33_013788, partial [Rhynchophorus ferrugineus]